MPAWGVCPSCGWPEGALIRVGGFCVTVLPYWMVRLISFEMDLKSHLLDVSMMFFVEGSILAQDERWRRA